MTKTEAINPNTAATTMERWAIFRWRRCSRKSPEIPVTNREARRNDELVV
jgi:hypothetical protein